MGSFFSQVQVHRKRPLRTVKARDQVSRLKRYLNHHVRSYVRSLSPLGALGPLHVYGGAIAAFARVPEGVY